MSARAAVRGGRAHEHGQVAPGHTQPVHTRAESRLDNQGAAVHFGEGVGQAAAAAAAAGGGGGGRGPAQVTAGSPGACEGFEDEQIAR